MYETLMTALKYAICALLIMAVFVVSFTLLHDVYDAGFEKGQQIRADEVNAFQAGFDAGHDYGFKDADDGVKDHHYFWPIEKVRENNGKRGWLYASAAEPGCC